MLRAKICRAVVTLWLQNTHSWQTFKAQARNGMPVSSYCATNSPSLLIS